MSRFTAEVAMSDGICRRVTINAGKPGVSTFRVHRCDTGDPVIAGELTLGRAVQMARLLEKEGQNEFYVTFDYTSDALAEVMAAMEGKATTE